MRVQFDRLSETENVFEQLYRQTKHKSTKLYRVPRGVHEEGPFRARFIGENSYDAGGPFRDVMENICQEITDRFLKPTSNMASLGDISSYQPLLKAGPQELKRFLYIGKMIGFALQ